MLLFLVEMFVCICDIFLDTMFWPIGASGGGRTVVLS